MRGCKRLGGRIRRRGEERSRFRRRKHRRGRNRFTMPRRQKCDDANMGRGTVRMHSLMQSGRGTQQSRDGDG